MEKNTCYSESQDSFQILEMITVTKYFQTINVILSLVRKGLEELVGSKLDFGGENVV